MDKDTVRWANRALRTMVDGERRAALAEYGYSEPFHNAGLLALVTCKTCGSILRIEPGENFHLLRHWRRHRPVRWAIAVAYDALSERRAKAVHSDP